MNNIEYINKVLEDAGIPYDRRQQLTAPSAISTLDMPELVELLRALKKELESQTAAGNTNVQT